MGAYLRNSLAAILGSVIIDLLLAIPAAYSLARYKYRFREDIGEVCDFPTWIPDAIGQIGDGEPNRARIVAEAGRRFFALRQNPADIPPFQESR